MDVTAFDDLLLSLAGLCASEGRPDADRTARALIRARGARPEFADLPAPNAAALALTLEQSRHPFAPLLVAVAPRLAWVPSELDGRIRPEIANRMMQADLIGPDGMVFDAEVRVGLFVMEPGLAYPERAHAAEETFFILSGHAEWSAGGGAFAHRGEGAMIHHPSMLPHANTTTDVPMLTAWRWSGDIGFEDYTLKG